MEQNNDKNDELEKRKKRVRNLKRAIIITLICAILIPIIMCVCLLIKVGTMQKQIDQLYEMRKNTKKQEQLAQEEAVKKEQEAAEILASKLPETMETEEVSDQEDDGRKKVYLTFDDGPSTGTEEILAVLKEYDVKATFFVVGKEDDYSMEMYKKIIDEGHTLGMHSYSHQYSTIYQSVEAFAQDIERQEALLKEATGEDIRLFRFPGGSSNLVSNIGMQEFVKYLNEEGITYFDWNVSSGDATSKSLEPENLVQNVVQDVGMYKNSVVLMHDASDKPNTVQALPMLIEQLKEMEVDILPITEDVKPIQHIKADEVENN